MDLRVYLTAPSQAILESSINVKPKTAELLWAYIDVEPVPFNKGFYTVDVKYFYRIVADAFAGLGRPKEISGLATYDKRTVLFGSEGSVRIFSSQYLPQEGDIQHFERTNLPIGVVEVVDPVILNTKVLEGDCCEDSIFSDIPESISACFDDDLVISDNGKRLYATLGQFSIIRLERDIQLLMPSYDVCMPEKECSGNTDDPCELFQRFRFPVDEFFPPKISDMVQQNNGAGGSSRRRR
ncbi:MAG: hypothetical protein IJU78_01825 [Clostridia bacterium]|nr:hypothetical protein [Clostridia bacterium]